MEPCGPDLAGLARLSVELSNMILAHGFGVDCVKHDNLQDPFLLLFDEIA